MKIVAKLLAVALLSVACERLSAADPIDGAFGFKFGEVLDEAAVIAKGPSDEISHHYQVKPGATNSYFEKYAVTTDIKTQRIIGITAYGHLLDKDEAVKQKMLLVKVLEEKYGKSIKAVSETTPLLIKSGKYFVGLDVMSKTEPKTRLRIGYYDIAANKDEAGEEKKVDKSGL